jgi:hypothetical protein
MVACLALRHIDEVNLAQREQVLIALVEVLPEREALLANDALQSLRESNRLQMELTGMLLGNSSALDVQAACQRLATTTPEARAYSRGYIAGQRRTA